MERKTSLASGIEVTKEKADYDAACKRLLSEKIILAWIMKSCLEEFRDIDVNVIAEKCIEGQSFVSEIPVAPDETGAVIQGVGQEHSSPTEGSIYFDIYFNAIVPGTEEVVQLIINVEAQANYYAGYPLLKRGVFYCGRMISAQGGTVIIKSHYEKLRKVYSIWLCTDPPKGRQNTITRYRMTEENMVGDVHENIQNYDLLTLVIICLGNKQGQNYDGILKLLGVLLSTDATPAEKKQILQDEFNIPMTQTMDREVSLMCNLSQGVENRGIEKGMKQGLEQGYENGLLVALKNIMGSMGLSADEAMNALRIPETDRQSYLAKLSQ